MSRARAIELARECLRQADLKLFEISKKNEEKDNAEALRSLRSAEEEKNRSQEPGFRKRGGKEVGNGG